VIVKQTTSAKNKPHRDDTVPQPITALDRALSDVLADQPGKKRLPLAQDSALGGGDS
jgi:hypothetical protein